jgi:uncharacterized delta-60 repeat protein
LNRASGGGRPGAAALVAFLCCLLVGWAQAGAAGPSRVGLDSTFAGRGFVVDARLGGIQVAEDGRGRLLVAGSRGGELVAVRYLPDGRPDGSYGAGGVARIALPGTGARPAELARVGDVAVQADGKLVIGGSFRATAGTGLAPAAVLARLTPNGSLDAGFGGSRAQGGEAGLVVLSAREAIDAVAIAGQKILVGGNSGRGFVGRFNPDGSLDRSFGGGRLGGWFNLPPRSKGQTRVKVEAGVEGLLSGPGGTVYAAGYASGRFMVARLRRDGHLDRSFGKAGLALLDAGGRRSCGCSVGEGLARDRRGRILVSGSLLSRRRGAHRDVAVARFSRGGDLDHSFADGGVARVRLGPETWGGPPVVQPGGRIVVAGSVGRSNGTYRLALVAFRPDGSRDRSFFGDGAFEAGFGARSSEATDVIADRHGRLVVAGSARSGGAAEPSGLLARFSD